MKVKGSTPPTAVILTVAVSPKHLISLVISGNSSGIWIELAAMLMLIALSSIFAAVFSLIVRHSRIFTVCIPMLLLGSLIFCPVFINAGSYIPAARFAEKLFVPYYYLELFM